MNYNHLGSIRSPRCSVLVTVSTAAPWLRANWLRLSSEAPLLADVVNRGPSSSMCVVSNAQRFTVIPQRWRKKLDIHIYIVGLMYLTWGIYDRGLTGLHESNSMMVGTHSLAFRVVFTPIVCVLSIIRFWCAPECDCRVLTCQMNCTGGQMNSTFNWHSTVLIKADVKAP